VNEPATPDRAYHHGDLRQALIETAEALLAERGPAGFTLRECARRAGVSVAAPAHHFGNMTGILTAIATLGFQELAAAMERAAAESDGTPHGQLRAIGRAYVTYAFNQPHRFRVIFGRLPLDKTDSALAAAGARAFGVLASTIAALPGRGTQNDGDVALAWSAVHGFATLALDKHFGEDRPIEPLLEHILAGLERALA
jgi:AcrR family transcriptional regulator